MKVLMTAVTVLSLTAGLAGVAVAQGAKQQTTKTPAQMKADMARVYSEAWNKGNMAVLDELVAPNFVDHAHPSGKKGPESARATFTMIRSAFPDVKFTPTAIAVDGDHILVHYWMEGTNKGAFMGMPATNKRVKVQGFDHVRTANGKAVEHWGQMDDVGMMKQLGHMAPSHGKPGAKGQPKGQSKGQHHGDHGDHKHAPGEMHDHGASTAPHQH